MESMRNTLCRCRGIRKAFYAFVCLFLLSTAPLIANAAGEPERIQFKPVRAQFIAALGDGDATNGTGAEHWGIWTVDPGPRGVWLRDFDKLESHNGLAPAGWKFDKAGWWVDENGLIMEEPSFPLKAGHYLVTGEREVITMLTVYEPDADGSMRWELARDAQLQDITHLPCRSALYTNDATQEAICTPANVPLSKFKVPPGTEMPDVPGCHRQDYRVLIVIGLPVDV